MSQTWNKIRRLILVFLIGGLGLAYLGSSFYADWYWFGEVGLRPVFLTMLVSNWGLRVAVFLFFFAFFLLNLLFTRPAIIPDREAYHHETRTLKEYLVERFVTRRRLNLFFLLVSFLAALFFAPMASGKWYLVQQYFRRTAFGQVDPLFGKDIGFFVFELPFWHYIYSLLLVALLGAALVTGLIYLIFQPASLLGLRRGRFTRPQVHFSILVALFFALQGWGFRLRAFNLVLSPRGVVFGAGYTDVHAQLPAYNILAFISLLCAALILINAFRRNLRLVFGSVILLASTYFLLAVVYPLAVQKFQVEPNEFSREEPYLKYNIAFTRKAYGLDKISERSFPAAANLTPEKLAANRATLENIRLWDYRPLQQTYSQLQEIRPYYRFKDIDIDRYNINGTYRQVMLSARELDVNKLPDRAKNWINKKLRYTHGYGLAMSPANAVTAAGQPEFLIGDLPIKSPADLPVKSPQIYFGELTDDYIIVNSKIAEFDYPSSGDEDFVETRYNGSGGVALNNLWRRVIFAFYFSDYRLFISGEVDTKSRILYNRNIHQRVRKAMPLLRYDRDPYLVVADGRLFWIQDAYTTTNMYPYSEPAPEGYNYLRNAVKVVIDAYNGSMDFYLADPGDPLALTLQKIFPGIFKPLEEMPASLRLHLRYPEELFLTQAKMLTNYHMENPMLFYNKEDFWSIPEEISGNKRVTMEPYYTLLRLPGEQKPEFVLMLPFTPARKVNMISWLAARNDPPNYGELILFTFPKDRAIYGPMQIEARIDQDAQISQQLTLWDQRGSQVIRGNLLVLPVEDSLIYVEPIFLQAQESKLPELRRVIVAHGERLAMAETLDQALQAVLGGAQARPVAQTPGPASVPPAAGLADLIEAANRLYNEALERQKAGDWAGYGRSLDELRQVLQKMKQLLPPG
ncbi:MAG: uncharacterized protein PWP65_942 [Clostridia bacterium]|nr:uncharacterized protein [Clostridia bacterium]